jgi:hypothetical protein
MQARQPGQRQAPERKTCRSQGIAQASRSFFHIAYGLTLVVLRSSAHSRPRAGHIGTFLLGATVRAGSKTDVVRGTWSNVADIFDQPRPSGSDEFISAVVLPSSHHCRLHSCSNRQMCGLVMRTTASFADHRDCLTGDQACPKLPLEGKVVGATQPSRTAIHLA